MRGGAGRQPYFLVEKVFLRNTLMLVHILTENPENIPSSLLDLKLTRIVRSFDLFSSNDDSTSHR